MRQRAQNARQHIALGVHSAQRGLGDLYSAHLVVEGANGEKGGSLLHVSASAKERPAVVPNLDAALAHAARPGSTLQLGALSREAWMQRSIPSPRAVLGCAVLDPKEVW